MAHGLDDKSLGTYVQIRQYLRQFFSSKIPPKEQQKLNPNSKTREEKMADVEY